MGRLEIAWILLLLGGLSVDTLTASQALSGEIRSAQIVRFGAVIVALVLCLPNVYRSVIGIRGGIYRGRGTQVFVIYVLITMISVLWSVSPIVTVGKSLELFVGLLVVLCVAAHTEGVSRLNRLFNLSLAFMLVILLVIASGYFVDPASFTRSVRMTGGEIVSAGRIPISSNAIARFGAYVSLFAMATFLFCPPKRYLWRALVMVAAVFGVGMALLAHGRTGIAAFIIGIIVLVARRSMVLGVLLGIFFLIVSFGVFYEQWVSFVQFFMRGQTQEMFLGLSGRIGWWMAGTEALRESWLVGYGFGIGSRVAFVTIDFATVSGMHNGFLEVLLGVGFVGGIFWFVTVTMFLWRSAIAIVSRRDIPYAIMSIPLLFATLLSSGMGGWWSVELGLFLILLAVQDIRARPRRAIRSGMLR